MTKMINEKNRLRFYLPAKPITSVMQ